MAEKRTLLKGGTVLSLDPKLGNHRQADVLIEGSKIAQVGVGLEAANAEVVDASNTVVMPGFVDSHRHLWEGILRNIGVDIPLEGDISYLAFILNTLAPAYRAEDAYIGDLISCYGMLDAGITTVLDWSHIQATPEHTDAVVKALQDSGMRAVFAYGNPWWKYPEPDQDEWFRKAAAQYFSSKDQLLTLGYASPGPEFLPEGLAEAHWKMAREVDAHITAHVGVGSFGRFDKVGEMARAGLLGPDTTYIHCTTLNDDEIQAIVDTGGTVSLALPVEMMMGHGMPPTQRFLDRGLAPSLSVDVETNVPSDMFTQMRSVASLQHVMCFDQKFAGAETIPDQITSRDVISWATVEGARANALDHKIGTLTPGKEADVIMLRTDRINVMPVNDPIGAVVWGMDTSNVDSVWVAGQAKKRDGKLLDVDLKKLGEQAAASRDYVVATSGFNLPEI
jgi:cytosine/adenosine deaminase-related metal-dependent hydrolase